jgi:OOP family OmpA-OmpF porin
MTLQYKRFLISALVSGACLFSGSVLAQDIGWYMGAAVGQSKFDAPGVIGATSITTDDKDTGFKIYGGYQLSRSLAVEVGYVDFGTISQRGTPGPFTISYDLTGLTVAAVGTMPLNGNFSLFGKAGLIALDISASKTGPVTVVTENGTEFLVGLGGRYNLNRNLAIQAEWEYFGGDLKTNFLSIGLRYKF